MEETSAMFECIQLSTLMSTWLNLLKYPKSVAEMKLAVGLLVDKSYLTCVFILLILKNLKQTVTES